MPDTASISQRTDPTLPSSKHDVGLSSNDTGPSSYFPSTFPDIRRLRALVSFSSLAGSLDTYGPSTSPFYTSPSSSPSSEFCWSINISVLHVSIALTAVGILLYLGPTLQWQESSKLSNANVLNALSVSTSSTTSFSTSTIAGHDALLNLKLLLRPTTHLSTIPQSLRTHFLLIHLHLSHLHLSSITIAACYLLSTLLLALVSPAQG